MAKEFAMTSLRVGALLVFVWMHTPNDPTAEEWTTALDAMSLGRRKVGVPMSDVRVLVLSDGGAPGGAQRARMASELPIKSSVITTVLANPVKRGIATALSWINPRFFFGGPKDAKEAAAHLDLEGAWDQIWPLLIDLQKELPKNQTLALVAKTLGRSLE